ncbi:MAG TPA: HWE histidine kinase domain-containing protein [Phenylobacterium sp.]|nr:HWE histidine kinase domain-containing protein [Phenylobacterium sp.]
MAVAAALVLAGLVMAVFNEQQVRNQQLREVSVQADILAGSVAAALAFDDHAAAREYVGALRANPEVEAVGVYDASGRLAAGYARAGIVLPTTNKVRPPSFDAARLTVTAPVVQGTTRLGSVYLRAITEPLPRRVARYAGVGVLVLMAALVVAVFGASNASLARAHRRLQVEMVERAKAEAALRESQVAIATERGRAALRQSEQQLELALNAGRLGTWLLDLKDDKLMASEFLRAAVGVGATEPFDRYADLVALVHPGDKARQQREMESAIRNRSDLESEFRVLAPGGEVRWILLRGRAAGHEVGDDAGQATRMAGVSLDITDRKRADERQKLLLDELNHRVKNTLASVQSIALQTRRTATDPKAFEEAFLARLVALSRAHDLLTEVAWEGASLKDVIGRTIAPYAADGQTDRLRLAGPNVRLNPNAAVSLAMAFHELATNAGKYGALSAAGGHVDIEWNVDSMTSPTVVEIDWRERGGPPVAPPTRRGFGSRLLETGLAREFDGKVELSFEPEGVRCHMRLPLSRKMQLAA